MRLPHDPPMTPQQRDQAERNRIAAREIIASLKAEMATLERELRSTQNNAAMWTDAIESGTWPYRDATTAALFTAALGLDREPMETAAA